MSEGTGYSNSIRAGAFLLTGALLALVIILVLSKTSAFSRMNDYVVVFTMEDGVGGVEIGSEVRVAGLKVGRVTEIVQKFEEQRIEVEIEMRADIALHKDAVVIRSQPLLGNFSWLNFSSLGTEAGGRMNPGDQIDARKSGGLLATIVGPANASNADRMFADLVAFTGALNDFAKVQYPDRVVPILRDANQTVS
ncbi:MAG: MlaD family protein, partial [Phycisphaerales bacterium]